MSYLLDSNAWIRYLKDPQSDIGIRLQQTPSDEIAICSIVKAELYYGAFKGTHTAQNLQLLGTIFGPFVSWDFDDAAAEHCGRIRAFLSQQGQLIGPNDFMIASIALAHDATLVTHNLGEFRRVPNLKVETWQIP